MLNEWLLAFARWLDTFSWGTQLHESIYMYPWVESTHVLSLMVFLGMLFIIDLRMLGFAFGSVPASTIADRLAERGWGPIRARAGVGYSTGAFSAST